MRMHLETTLHASVAGNTTRHSGLTYTQITLNRGGNFVHAGTKHRVLFHVASALCNIQSALDRNVNASCEGRGAHDRVKSETCPCNVNVIFS